MFNIIKKEKIKYFDIHSHLHSNFFKDDINKYIQSMKKNNIFTISVGVNFSDSLNAIKLSNKHYNIYAIIGIHPTEKECFKKNKFEILIKKNKKIIGIGECGLDYFWLYKDLKNKKINKEQLQKDKTRQKILFKKQINFAIENNLPLMLHIRPHKNSDAYFDAFQILKENKKIKNIKVNFHFFTENLKVAEIIWKND